LEPQPVDKSAHVLGKIARGHFGDWLNLYNLAMDPSESYNLASRYPEICKKMEKGMLDWEETVRKNPGGWLRSKHA
jgi:hypothetical protein